MDSGAGVTDLRASRDRRTVLEAGGRHGPTHRLRDDFVGLEVEVPSRTEALDGGIDQARVDLAQPLPGEAEPIDDARSEVLHEDIDPRHQIGEDPVALWGLHVQRDAALVAIEHCEVQAVGAWHVAKLAAGDVASAGSFELDDVCAEPGE